MCLATVAVLRRVPAAVQCKPAPSVAQVLARREESFKTEGCANYYGDGWCEGEEKKATGASRRQKGNPSKHI